MELLADLTVWKSKVQSDLMPGLLDILLRIGEALYQFCTCIFSPLGIVGFCRHAFGVFDLKRINVPMDARLAKRKMIGLAIDSDERQKIRVMVAYVDAMTQVDEGSHPFNNADSVLKDVFGNGDNFLPILEDMRLVHYIKLRR